MSHPHMICCFVIFRCLPKNAILSPVEQRTACAFFVSVTPILQLYFCAQNHNFTTFKGERRQEQSPQASFSLQHRERMFVRASGAEISAMHMSKQVQTRESLRYSLTSRRLACTKVHLTFTANVTAPMEPRFLPLSEKLAFSPHTSRILDVSAVTQ